MKFPLAVFGCHVEACMEAATWPASNLFFIPIGISPDVDEGYYCEGCVAELLTGDQAHHVRNTIDRTLEDDLKYITDNSRRTAGDAIRELIGGDRC